MAALNIITNNPFRILGVYANSKAKDIVANSKKAKAFAQVNKQATFPSDFSKWLPPFERTVSSIDSANANISQNDDKLKFALFWFVKETSLDDIALGYLAEENISKAKEILSKRQTYSSLLNAGVLALLEGDYKVALNNYSTLLHEYRFRTDFLDAICGNKNGYSETKVVESFYETLLNVVSAQEILTCISKDYQDYELIRQKAIEHPVGVINSELSISKNADKSASSQLQAGTQLMNNTRQALFCLKEIIGHEEQYQLVADNLAKQILQCGINYYNHSDDFDCARKAYVLQHYAYTIAVGQLTKEKCKDNIDVLQKAIDALPPEELQYEALNINAQLASFRTKSRDISNAIRLIIDCGPYLAAIKACQGVNGNYYRRMSTRVEEAALGCTIDVVNASLKKFDDAREFEKYLAISTLKLTLKKAWDATLYMAVLDIEEEAKARYNSQRQSLKNLLSQAGVSSSSDISFKLETEQEIFNACNAKADFKKYVERFHRGKYVAAAKKKIDDIEKLEAEEKRQLLQNITNATNFSDAIALLPKIKDDFTKGKLDDKCFELCSSRSHYRKYVEKFGNNARHLADANEHLKLDRFASNISDYIKKHKVWFIIILIAIVVIVGTGLIWGASGYSSLLMGIGIISGLIAFGGISSKEGSGCLIGIVAGIIAFLCIGGSDMINESIKTQRRIAEENAALTELRNNPTLEDCINFLSKHRGSSHEDEVLGMYYYSAESEGVLSLNKLAEDYKDTKWGEKAAERIQQLCDSLYQIADNSNTINAWRAYQSAVPSAYYSDSEEKIEEIENQAWNTDAKAWNQACKENTQAAYEKYLDLYPHGLHKAVADKKVIDMQVANVYAGDHGELPSMEQTGYGGGTYSRVTIDNSTSYTLTLLYSGPDSKRLVIAPNQSSSVSLRNGTYRIAASVNDYSVRNFAGSETLHGGNYSATYYISTSRY